MTEAEQKKIKGMAWNKSALAADDRQMMAEEMEQAGYLAYLENKNPDFLWSNIQHAMTNVWLRWRFGVKRVVAKSARRDRIPAVPLEPEHEQIACPRPLPEEMVLAAEILRYCEAKILAQPKPQRYLLVLSVMLENDGNNPPNGTWKNAGMSANDARYRRDRIKLWARECL